MDNKDIKTLAKVLVHQKREDLAELLAGSKSEIVETGQFGTVWNSVISIFVIYSPIEKYYKFKELETSDLKVLSNAVHDLYPVVSGEPEIVSVEFRLAKEEGADKLVIQTHVGRTVRAFISYSTEDKIIAGKIKQGLEVYGIETFLAHEDIDPAAEWELVILDNLESTDVFVAIITDSFSTSKWTDQESGIAFTKGKVIIPISIGGKHPYGFIGKYQSLKFNTDSRSIDCEEIIKAVIKRKPQLETQILDSLIKSFITVNSWESAKNKARLLLSFDKISKQQINDIFQGVLTNDQIHGSFGAQGSIKALFNTYGHLINDELLEELKIKKIIK